MSGRATGGGGSGGGTRGAAEDAERERPEARADPLSVVAREESDRQTKEQPHQSRDSVGGATFVPSPEILFLVQQQAKTLSALSAISKRLEELEVKVCDMQRTVSAASSGGGGGTKGPSLLVADAGSSSKCSGSGSGQQNVLSDDSGGEYSRTTNGTTVDEDELISLLDQIAKYSQTIRETQQSQAQQQLASLSSHQQSPAQHSAPPATASPPDHGLPGREPRCREPLLHGPSDHPSSSPAALMTDHVASSRLTHHAHRHHHHHNQSSLQQQQQQSHHLRNQCLTHANPSRSSTAAFPGFRPTAGLHATDFGGGRSGGGGSGSGTHLAPSSSATTAAAADPASLGALLFDPNLTSVLANLLTPPRSRNRDF